MAAPMELIITSEVPKEVPINSMATPSKCTHVLPLGRPLDSPLQVNERHQKSHWLPQEALVLHTSSNINKNSLINVDEFKSSHFQKYECCQYCNLYEWWSSNKNFLSRKRKDTKTYRIKIPPAHPRYGLARNGFYDISHQALVEKIAFAAPANSWHVIRFNKRTFDLTKYVHQAECGHSVCRFRNHYYKNNFSIKNKFKTLELVPVFFLKKLFGAKLLQMAVWKFLWFVLKLQEILYWMLSIGPLFVINWSRLISYPYEVLQNTNSVLDVNHLSNIAKVLLGILMQ